jgi:Ni/Co efflux regulator RcnB
MRRTRLVLLCLFAALFLAASMAATAVADEWKDEAHGKERKEHKEKHRSKGKDLEHRGSDGYFHAHGYTTLDIPPGHLPPPGKCRLWYPDRPPGHQPPPESCGQLRYYAPAGAWLIHRPKDRPKYVDVSVYDAYQPCVVITIGLFDVDTGAFLRHLRPR